MWVDTLIYSGWRSIRTIPKMTSIFLKSKRGATLSAIAILSLLFWLSPVAINPSPYRYEMSIILVFSIFLLWHQPPSVLFLGESSRQTGVVLGKFSSSVLPLRVVALLDHRRTGYLVGGFSILTDNLRTQSDYHWRQTVDDLADLLPTIILDARTDKEIVVKEVAMIYGNKNRLSRTYFISDINGNAPALAANGLSILSEGVRSIKPEEILDVVKEMKNVKNDR